MSHEHFCWSTFAIDNVVTVRFGVYQSPNSYTIAIDYSTQESMSLTFPVIYVGLFLFSKKKKRKQTIKTPEPIR